MTGIAWRALVQQCRNGRPTSELRDLKTSTDGDGVSHDVGEAARGEGCNCLSDIVRCAPSPLRNPATLDECRNTSRPQPTSCLSGSNPAELRRPRSRARRDGSRTASSSWTGRILTGSRAPVSGYAMVAAEDEMVAHRPVRPPWPIGDHGPCDGLGQKERPLGGSPQASGRNPPA